MQDLNDFLTFKTEVCQENLCPCYRNLDLKQIPQEYAECPYHHNPQDNRRVPYKDASCVDLAYECSIRDEWQTNSNQCKNRIEFMYHPLNFKTLPCENCAGYYCPNYHSLDEKVKWDTILKRSEVSNIHPIEHPKTINANEESSTASSGLSTNLQSFTQISNYDDKHSRNDIKLLEKDQHQDFEESILKLMTKIISNSKENPNIPQKVEDKAQILLKDKFEPENLYRGAFDYAQEEESMPIPNPKTFSKFSLENLQSQFVEIKEEEKQETLLLETQGAKNTKEWDNLILNGESSILIPSGPEIDYGTKNYYLNEKVDIVEDMYNEFKLFKAFSLSYLEELIEKYACSFLNAKGGTLYLGIDDDGYVSGVRLNRRAIDDICIAFDRKLKNFHPAVRADQYSIKLNHVFDNRSNPLHSIYVVELHFDQGDPSELYFNDRKECFIRKLASSIQLQPAGIK